LQQHFVALASDADDPEDGVLSLAYRLEDAMMLPFVMFADAEGRFLEGSSGAVKPGSISRDARETDEEAVGTSEGREVEWHIRSSAR